MIRRCSVSLMLTLLILGAPHPLPADTHYVSKTGSRAYPYDSWATAADTVARAVEAAAEWDTILIAAGHYVSDTIMMKKGQVLKGSGQDSTVLDTLPWMPMNPLIARDSCQITDMTFRGAIYPLFLAAADYENAFRVGIVITVNQDQAVTVRRVTFETVSGGVKAFFTNLNETGRICSIDSCRFVIFREAASGYFATLAISACDFRWDQEGGSAIFLDNGTLTVQGCRFWGYDPLTVEYGTKAIRVLRTDPIIIRNNLFYSTNIGPALELNFDGLASPVGEGVIENNTFFRCYGHLHIGRPGFVFRSNISMWSASSGVILSPQNAQSTYNITWDNTPWDSGVIRTGDTIPNDIPGNTENRNVSPMFVDTLQFLLQAFSPAIDAGDPGILDADGSRSDIGYAGGPGGFTYAYQDLPPKVPVLGLSASLPNGFAFEWSGNHEADFDRYELERSPIPEAAGDSAVVIATLPHGDTAFTDSTIPGSGTWYYRIRAFDQQGNPSDYSNELSVAVVGIGDEDETLPEVFALHPNYPNPFNAATKITYTLPQPANITLTVYDALGRKVETLVQAPQSAGEHSILWDAEARGSGVYFMVLSTPDGRAVQKALLLK